MECWKIIAIIYCYVSNIYIGNVTVIIMNNDSQPTYISLFYTLPYNHLYAAAAAPRIYFKQVYYSDWVNKLCATYLRVRGRGIMCYRRHQQYYRRFYEKQMNNTQELIYKIVVLFRNAYAYICIQDIGMIRYISHLNVGMYIWLSLLGL